MPFFTSLQDGISPVCVASGNGHTKVVDLLVQAGADINLTSTEVHVSTHTVSSSVAAVVETNVRLINPRRARAHVWGRVIVSSRSVCVLCRPLKLHLQPAVRFPDLRYKCLEDAGDVSPAPEPVGANASSIGKSGF